MFSGFSSRCGPEFGGGRGGWSFNPGAFGFWMGGGGGKRRGFRGGRMFEQGDLKYVILKLLEEKPRHGYDIIKELEEKSGGAYAPSAGTVYPTLQLLEDLGYATMTPEEGGKRIFSITDTGREYLEQNKSAVEDLFDKLADVGASIVSDAVMDINRAFRDLAAAAYAPVRDYHKDTEFAAKVKEILDRTSKEIRDLAEARRATGGAA
ncbi:MAG: PadR family transcriptional regulator [Gemmatimonadaceae bacterium]